MSSNIVSSNIVYLDSIVYQEDAWKRLREEDLLFTFLGQSYNIFYFNEVQSGLKKVVK